MAAGEDDELCPPSDLVHPSLGLPLADYASLPLYCHEPFQKLLEQAHGVGGLIFLAEVMKLNKRLVEQRRVLAVTAEAFYVCTPRAEVLRCSRLSEIAEVYTSNKLVGLKLPGEYDLLVRVTNENRVPDNLLVKYLLHVLRSTCADETKFHYEQPWLDVSKPTNRATMRNVLVLNRPDSWTAQRPIPIPLLPWQSIALLPGFDAVWRRVHPARSKAVWAIKEQAELDADAPAASAASPSPLAADAAMVRTTQLDNVAAAAVRLDSERPRRAASAAKALAETTSAGRPTAGQQPIGLFDAIASSPQRRLIYSTTVPAAVAAAARRAGGDDEPRRAGSAVKAPLDPPPPAPPADGPQRGAAYVASGQGPYFPPNQVAGLYGAEEEEEEAGAAVPGLDPLVVELQSAACPVPGTPYELQQAVRRQADQQQPLDVDTPKLSYAADPPGQGAYPYARTATSSSMGVGVRPPMTPPPQEHLPAADAEAGAAAGAGSYERAVGFAKTLSDATNRPGGGGAEARRMLSEMLRTTAALIATEDKLERREAGLRAAGAATPSRDEGGAVRAALESDTYLTDLLSEQHKQRAELDAVCQKLDLLLQHPQHAPSAPVDPHTPTRGRWAHDDPGSGGADGLLGSALLPIPAHGRLSKYQQALHHSLRPLNHTPPSRATAAGQSKPAKGRTPKQAPRRMWVPS